MFGPHVSRARAPKRRGRPSIVEHIRAARAAAAEADFDAQAFQVFIAGPRNRTVTLRGEEADELRAYLDRTKLVAVAHGTYADYPWSGAPYISKFIRLELELCARAGILGLVIHLGKPPVATVMKFLPRLLSPQSEALVFLEVPHVKPEDSHYETPEKLAKLFEAVRRLDPTLCKFGLCIDTAHLWSCGVDLQSFEDAEAWIRRLEAVADVIPPGRIMLHLNDSHSERGSGLDRHAPLLGGKIWAEYADRPQHSGLAAFVDYAVRHETLVILERKPAEALLGDYSALERLTDAVRLL